MNDQKSRPTLPKELTDKWESYGILSTAYHKLVSDHYGVPTIEKSQLFDLFKADMIEYQTNLANDMDSDEYKEYDLPNLLAFKDATNWVTLIHAISNASWDFPSFLLSLLPIILKFEALDPYEFQNLIIGILHNPPHEWDT